VAASRRITVSYELVATQLPLKSTVDGPFPRFRELGDAGGLGGLLDPICARSSAGAAGDAEHGVVDAVASRATVAEDLPALHPSEGMLVRPQRHQRAEVVGDPVCRGLRDAEQQGHPAHRQVRVPVGRDQQHSNLQRQAPGPSPASRVGPLAPQRGHTNFPKQRGLSPENEPVQDGSDAVITPATP
jgi:hypothetical protein